MAPVRRFVKRYETLIAFLVLGAVAGYGQVVASDAVTANRSAIHSADTRGRRAAARITTLLDGQAELQAEVQALREQVIALGGKPTPAAPTVIIQPTPPTPSTTQPCKVRAAIGCVIAP